MGRRKYNWITRYISSRNFCRIISFMAIFLLLTPVVVSGEQAATKNEQTEKSAEQKEAPAPPKVTVEVKKADGKDVPEVKVHVEGKTESVVVPAKGPEPTGGILPLPGEKLAPLETEQIDKAAQKVGKKVDEIEFRLGLKWGSWVWTEAYLGITWFKLLAVILAITSVLLLERGISWFIKRRLSRSKNDNKEPKWKLVILDASRKPLSLFILVYGIYAALSPLFEHFDGPGLRNPIRTIAGGLTDLLGTVVVLWLLYSLLHSIERPLINRVSSQRDIDDLLVAIIGRSLRILIVTLGAIFLVQNLTGFEVGPLLASLGLGGLAVALAAKDSISNFFGTLTIVFDRPFQVGDHIKLDKYEGIVESIGFRSTLIRTLDGALVSIPNEKAINFGVENVGRRETIRWNTNIGLRHDTPPEKVAQAVKIVSGILDDEEHVRPNQPPRVFFNGFNDCGPNISVSVWYWPAIWWDYQSWRQDRCLKIMHEFQKEGIDFALPIRSLTLERNDFLNQSPEDDYCSK